MFTPAWLALGFALGAPATMLRYIESIKPAGLGIGILNHMRKNGGKWRSDVMDDIGRCWHHHEFGHRVSSRPYYKRIVRYGVSNPILTTLFAHLEKLTDSPGHPGAAAFLGGSRVQTCARVRVPGLGNPQGAISFCHCDYGKGRKRWYRQTCSHVGR
jgi:hypothetical protein